VCVLGKGERGMCAAEGKCSGGASFDNERRICAELFASLASSVCCCSPFWPRSPPCVRMSLSCIFDVSSCIRRVETKAASAGLPVRAYLESHPDQCPCPDALEVMGITSPEEMRRCGLNPFELERYIEEMVTKWLLTAYEMLAKWLLNHENSAYVLARVQSCLRTRHAHPKLSSKPFPTGFFSLLLFLYHEPAERPRCLQPCPCDPRRPFLSALLPATYMITVELRLLRACVNHHVWRPP
jgi:hypothetical protein